MRRLATSLILLSLPACSLLCDARPRAALYGLDAEVAAELGPRPDADGADTGGADARPEAGSPDAEPTLVIDEVTSNNPRPAAGDSTYLTWRVRGATQVEVRLGTRVILARTPPAEVMGGAELLALPVPGDLAFVASDGARSSTMALAVITPPREAVEPPTVLSLSPTSAGGPATVGLTWEASWAEQATLAYPVARAVATSGVDSQLLSATTHYVLTASATRPPRTRTATAVFHLVEPEIEDNDSTDTAQDLRSLAVDGRVQPGDEDYFRVLAPGGEWLFARMAPPCGPASPEIEQGGVISVLDDQGCSVWEAPFVPPANAGDQVLLRVRARRVGSPYSLRVQWVPAFLGNRRVDPGEACDDGSPAGGDGCAEGSVEPDQALRVSQGSAEPELSYVRDLGPFAAYSNPTQDQGWVVVPFPKAVPFMGHRYGGIVVHSSGLISFAVSSTVAEPQLPRLFPDPWVRGPLIGAALAPGLAVTGRTAQAGSTDLAGDQRTTILPPFRTGTNGDGTSFTVQPRVDILGTGQVELSVLIQGPAPDAERRAVFGVQHERGLLGAMPRACLPGCVLADIPAGAAFVFSP